MPLATLNDNLGVSQDYSQGFLLGRVENIDDPLGLNRFQVSIPGFFEDGELPWTGMIKDSPFGVGKGFGVYGSPAKGSTALLELQNGDANYPICHGFILTENDIDPRFRNGSVWGFVDPSGNTLIVDMPNNSWTFIHSSGTTYTIDGGGNLDATIVGHATVNINGNTLINTTGNTEVRSGGDTLVKASNATIDASKTTITGETIILGLLRALGGAVLIGDVDHSGGTMKSNGITASGHTHITPAGMSNPPQAGT